MKIRGWSLILCHLFWFGTLSAESNSRLYANDADLASERKFAEREADWRNGAIVYQVIVDRFAPPENLESKRALYPAPKKLRAWEELPRQGTYHDEAQVWSHEIDFWGGDLQSLARRVDYVHELGANVLYLNPIHLAYTNHKYDAQDYFAVSPEYGTREDVYALASDLHGRGMKLVLDGVFNHMGRTSPMFQEALRSPASESREWYKIGPEYKLGYRAWYNVANLPELNLESPLVRARLYGDPDSVIQGYLRNGIDGWRLDVAFDMGFRYLSELTIAAHTAKPGSVVIGEIWNYPEEWFPPVDGLMNMTARQIILEMVRGNLEGHLAGRHFERMVQDSGLEPLMKSWIILDNHDTQRLATEISEEWRQRMAQVLQFTVPGSPCVYYGVELGMTGGGDPEQRAPMRWDLAQDDNETLQWTRALIAARNDSRALRIGDFRLLDAAHCLAFMRRTDRVRDLVIVVANPGEEERREVLLLRDSKIMSGTQFRNAFDETQFSAFAGTLSLTVPAHTVYLLKPVIEQTIEYTPYKRVQ